MQALWKLGKASFFEMLQLNLIWGFAGLSDIIVFIFNVFGDALPDAVSPYVHRPILLHLYEPPSLLFWVILAKNYIKNITLHKIIFIP